MVRRRLAARAYRVGRAALREIATIATPDTFAQKNMLLLRNTTVGNFLDRCGISLPWIASPFLVFAIGMALVLLLFSSTVIPLASNKAEEIRAIRIEKKPSSTALKLPQPWARMGADTLLHVNSVAVAPDGQMEIPQQADRAGWYRHGPAPGERPSIHS